MEKQAEATASPLLTIKEVAELTGLSPHTLRYYDRMHLFPYVSRSGGNARLFSEADVEWVRLVSCLRKTGLPIADILRYVELCQAGDGTISERAEIVGRQEALVERNLADMEEQLKMIRRKKAYYDGLLNGKLRVDTMNPETPRPAGHGEACGD
jgi:DNA-binding transcriptional MerR regulator